MNSNSRIKAHETITATSAAIAHIQKCLGERNDACTIVRFSVKKSGCSGFAYVLDFTAATNSDDYVFTIADDSGEHIIQVAVDQQSFPFIKGTCLDYQVGQFGGVMKFLNPNEKASCGCGESFTIEPDVNDEDRT